MLVVVVDVRMRLPVSQFVARVPEESALAEVCFAAVADRTFTHHAAAVPHWGEWAGGRTKNTYIKKKLNFRYTSKENYEVRIRIRMRFRLGIYLLKRAVLKNFFFLSFEYLPVSVNVERRLVRLVRGMRLRWQRGMWRVRRMRWMRGRRRMHRVRGVPAVRAAPLRPDLLFSPPLRAPIREPHLYVGPGYKKRGMNAHYGYVMLSYGALFILIYHILQ